MPAPIIPWQPSNIPSEIQTELDRRKINRNFKFVKNAQGEWDKMDGDWNKYRGPMVSWIRMCSNSAGHPLVKKERFVLFSGKGFYQTYGFQPPATPGNAKYQVIGYTPGDFENADFGEPHTIENSLTGPSYDKQEGLSNWPINVPAPEISRIEVTVQKELFRRAQIEWVCFSWKQLVYMTPYFLVPGITCMVEWGWNHYNVQSLVNLGDKTELRKLWDNAYPLYTDNILKSNGNYGVIYGIVTNFNWSIEGNKIICTTEITSKDRLYAGIAKDYGLTVKDGGTDKQPGVFQSIKDFLVKDDTVKSLRTLVMQPDVTGAEAQLTQRDPRDKIWIDILNPLLTKGGPEVIGMRRPYVFGLFSGRPPELYDTMGTPEASDFDKSVQDNDPHKIWINMGMVVQILNHFSALESGGNNGKAMFEVDIQNSVIGGHPNLISCDPKVLIPNSKAPKFHYGFIGAKDAGSQFAQAYDDQWWLTTNVFGKVPKVPYEAQLHPPTTFKRDDKSSIADQTLAKVFYQGKTTCFRNDIDSIINFNRIRYVGLKGRTSALNKWSFPSTFDAELPETIRGLKKNQVEAKLSGLLSNIYISYTLLKDVVVETNDKDNVSYVDIYKKILQYMMDAVDGFWDLSLVEVEGVMTITDKKYVGKYALDKQGDKVYSFDYYDADSLIKSLKFRPALSDAQATRTIYGEVNNKDSKYKFLDKNDVLDYQFKDAVIGTRQDRIQGDASSVLAKRISAIEQHRDLVRSVQTINAKTNDPGLQMSIKAGDKLDIIKLILPNQQLLRMLLNDEDEESNARYCAVQPNIIIELTLQGIGGLRTFQYFIVRNLPEPYSDRNIIFRITDVHQTLEAGNWETTIRAQPLPLRAYIKTRLRGPLPEGATPTKNGWPVN